LVCLKDNRTTVTSLTTFQPIALPQPILLALGGMALPITLDQIFLLIWLTILNTDATNCKPNLSVGKMIVIPNVILAQVFFVQLMRWKC